MAHTSSSAVFTDSRWASLVQRFTGLPAPLPSAVTPLPAGSLPDPHPWRESPLAGAIRLRALGVTFRDGRILPPEDSARRARAGRFFPVGDVAKRISTPDEGARWTPPPARVVEGTGPLLAVLTAHPPGQRIVTLDTETTGLDPHRDRLVLVQMGLEDETVVIRAESLDRQGRTALVEYLENTGRVVLHHAKFDLKFLRALAGRPLNIRVFDTMLASQVIAAGQNVGEDTLKKLAVAMWDGSPWPVPREELVLPWHLTMAAAGIGPHSLAGVSLRWAGVLLDKTLQRSDWSGELTESQIRYSALDAAVLRPMYDRLEAEVSAQGLSRVIQIENEAAPAVSDMEFEGIRLDLDYWDGLRDHVAGEGEEARQELLSLLPSAPVKPRVLTLFDHPGTGRKGEEVNLDSPVQVKDLLDRLGIVVPNTDDDTLSPLAGDHPVVAALLRYRKARKSLTAFLDRYPGYVHPATGRIHASYQQINRKGTGRFSCTDPNVQQIPHDREFRRAFVPAPGSVFLIADYSQIELRIMGWLTRDQRMLEAFRTSTDLHRLTASLVTGKPMEEITKADRQLAKAVNFGLIYGMSAETFQKYAEVSYGVHLPLEEARRFRDRFFQAYRGVADWHQRQKKSAYDNLEVRTAAGRVRRWADRRFPPTECFNTPDQGTGADIMKRALALLRPVLIDHDAKLVANVHDEVVIEVPEEEAPALTPRVEQAMIRAGEELIAPVPVEVEAAIGTSWADKA